MVKIAVVGATGYAGEELLKILANHPQAEITSVSAKMDRPQKISEIFPELADKIDLVCAEPDFSKIIPNCDLVFLALPHRISMTVAPLFLEAGKKVIDLSADYRLRDPVTYQQWYGIKHSSPQYLKEAVYGLVEVYQEKIKSARIIANPGCYPTGIILGCLPLIINGLANPQEIIVDAKTGSSGAGREREAALRPQLQDNFYAYKVGVHQHTPEINQELSNLAKEKIEITFTPHLIPIKRGILSTIYLPLKKAISTQQALDSFQNFYHGKPFIKILPAGEFPQLKDVSQTNYCHIGLRVDPAKKIVVVICAIDNLVKGASGQAVQNMNVIYGCEETAGML